MAVRKKKVQTPVIEKKEPTKEYLLIRDYTTSKGVIKAGKTIKATLKGARILTNKKFI